MKCSGTSAFSSAVAGTDYVLPSGSITGNAATATKLQTARTINGVSFDGSASITIADNTKLPLSGGTLIGEVVAPDITGTLHGTSEGIPLVIGTQTVSTNAFTGDAPTISGLYDGLQIMYYLPVAGTSTSATLNLKLKDGTTTGAIPCYYQSSTRLTTHLVTYGVGTFIYRTSNGTITTPGWWMQTTYHADTYDRVYYSNAIQAAAAIYRYKWLCQDLKGKWFPIFPDDKSSTTVAGSWSVSSTELRIGSPILYYNTTATVAAGATLTNLYSTIPHEIRYNINVASLTNYSPVLLKGTIGPNGGFVVDSVDYYATVFPTTDDTYYYMYLGYMYSTTAMRLCTDHPVYYHKDGQLRIFAGETYTHPTGDGNQHVPATGTNNNGKVLKAGTKAGSAAWSSLVKSDVGLWFVDDYATATQAEAEVGTAPDKFMTAQRVAQAIAKQCWGNILINGDFKVWQRGTSFAASGYTADRFYISNATKVSQSADTPDESTQNSVLLTSTGLSSETDFVQRIENFAAIRGKTLTLSAMIKGSNGVTGQ